MTPGSQFGAVTLRRWSVAVIALAISVPLCAQSSKVYRDGDAWVEETTGTLPAAREFKAFTDLGSLEVDGNASQVSYVVRKRSRSDSEEEARRQFELLRISASRVGDAVILEGRLLGHNVSRLSADITVQVPRITQVVKVETRAGALALASLSGSVIGNTGAGNVKVDKVSGPVKIVSGGGNMEATNVTTDLFLQSGGGTVSVDGASGQVTVRTGGGKVHVGSAGPTTVETGAGSIDVGRCNGDLRASTGGGNLNLGDVSGSVIVDSGGGTVRVASAQGDVRVSTGGGAVELMKVGRSAHVETGGGPITVQFVARPGQFGDSVLHTALGNILVYLPRDLGVNIHASTEMTNGVGIKSDFSGVAITSEGGQYGPKSMFGEGPLNGGGPILRLRTTIGQIDIKRLQ
jgi:DUF4097 and DUF4098 domain-containing protein YvlB